MSTSNSPKGAPDLSTNDPDRMASLAAAAAGLPDPSILERMANEYFKSVPVAPGVGAMSLPAEPQSFSAAELTSLTLPSAGKIPTYSESGAISAAIPKGTALPGIAGVSIPSATLPGGLSQADFATAPSFSFLQEARSLFATPPAVPIHAAPSLPTQKIPNEIEVRDLAGLFSGTHLPEIPPSPSDVASPLISGAPARPAEFDRLASFGFLDEIKSLEPTNVFPTLAPVTAHLGEPGLANLPSVPFDVNSIRRDFPILQERVNGRPLIWLDNAATTQKPQSVIDRISYFYEHENSNIHRAAHTLAARATDAYEAARDKVRRFLNASSPREIIFVRGATEAINLVAQSWGRRNVQKDDEIVITWLEHHANIVPWQMLCAEKGAKLRVAPVDDTGQVLLDEYEKLLNPRTRLVSFAQVSNALGTVTPVQEMVEMAHRQGAKVLVDGAQAVSHMRVDVQAYDCDFYVFSGHKIFAPTGIGVVYGKPDVLDVTPPWQGGGNMIADVTFEKTLYQPPPLRFEAGTGSIADAVGLGAALDYLDRIGMVNISRYEHDLLMYATEALQRIPGLHLIGTAREKASVLSFVLDGFRTEDVGTALNQEGIAVRSGHHCAQPILRRFGVESTVRPSLAFYNTCEEIDALVAALWNLKIGRNPSVA
jgi:cysteine desulfurase/selenocysteine lyase